MSYELKIWTANKGLLLNTITQAAAGGLEDGFKWQLTSAGDTVQLEGTGRNDRLRIAPRSVVSLSVDGEPAFYGIVPDPPAAGNQETDAWQVLGGREALRCTLMDGVVYRNQGVYTIARHIFGRLTPPTLTYDPTLIGDGSGTDTGPIIPLYYAPTSDLSTVLSALGKAAGAGAGVDVQGRIFLGRPAAAARVIAYAGQPWRQLRVQGREAVTEAVLRAVSAPSLPSGARLRNNYLPRTVTVAAQHAQHSLYLASKSVEPPDGVSVVTGLYVTPMTGSQHPSNPAPITNVGNMVDGDPDTYAEVPIGFGNLIFMEAPASRVIGYRLTYSLPDYKRLADFDVGTYTRRGDFDTTLYLANTGARQTVVVIIPPGADTTGNTWYTNATVETAVHSTPPSPPVAMRIYDFQLLSVDDVTAQRVAETFLQVPFTTPAEITLPGLFSPTPQVTVTGSPDGDVTGDTALWEYTHQSDELRSTRIRLGSDGQSDVGRAIKFALKGA